MQLSTVVRISAAVFGSSLLISLILLGDLLGSAADSTRAFTEQFDDTATRIGHVLGAIFLTASAISLLVFGLAFRRLLLKTHDALSSDVIVGLAGLSAAGLLVAASLLTSPSLVRTVGELTDDPGMESNTAAGIAQAGTVVFVFTMLLIGLLTVIVGRVARQQYTMTRWLQILGWIVAILTIVGLAVSTLFPLGLYWLAVGGWLRTYRTMVDAN